MYFITLQFSEKVYPIPTCALFANASQRFPHVCTHSVPTLNSPIQHPHPRLAGRQISIGSSCLAPQGLNRGLSPLRPAPMARSVTRLLYITGHCSPSGSQAFTGINQM